MPKWWATSWTTVSRTCSMISSLVAQSASMDPLEQRYLVGQHHAILGPLRQGDPLVEPQQEVSLLDDVSRELVLGGPVLHHYVNVVQVGAERIWDLVQRPMYQPLELGELHADSVAERLRHRASSNPPALERDPGRFPFDPAPTN